MNKWLPSILSLTCIAAFFLAAMAPPKTDVSAQEMGAPRTDMDEQAEELAQKKQRLREGAEIVDEVGTFEWVGDRLSFSADKEKAVFKILENRMMERVVQTQEASTGDLVWVVTGTITEYRGSNFLLMRHVTLEGKRND